MIDFEKSGTALKQDAQGGRVTRICLTHLPMTASPPLSRSVRNRGREKQALGRSWRIRFFN